MNINRVCAYTVYYNFVVLYGRIALMSLHFEVIVHVYIVAYLPQSHLHFSFLFRMFT